MKKKMTHYFFFFPTILGVVKERPSFEGKTQEKKNAQKSATSVSLYASISCCEYTKQASKYCLLSRSARW